MWRRPQMQRSDNRCRPFVRGYGVVWLGVGKAIFWRIASMRPPPGGKASPASPVSIDRYIALAGVLIRNSGVEECQSYAALGATTAGAAILLKWCQNPHTPSKSASEYAPAGTRDAFKGFLFALWGMQSMRSLIVKRSIAIGGRETSVSLEDAFWSRLKEIARQRQMAVSDLIATIDSHRRHGNLSSALRIFVLDFYCSHTDEVGHHSNAKTDRSATPHRRLRSFGLIFTSGYASLSLIA
jgi:predicted DNA-binding ribbon-helix-helix protein